MTTVGMAFLAMVAAVAATMGGVQVGHDEGAEVTGAQGNRLQHEGSAYLRQHARNPVDWYPWGEEALERARELDRPIFLSIGYASCHWCHVMEREVFEKHDVAAFLNAHFVSIKVDREERPDLDAVYMAAVQRITGNGGWPLSVFLTPAGKPFFGGTYFPRERFLGLLERIDTAWTSRRPELDAQAAALAGVVASGFPTDSSGSLPDDLLERSARASRERFDDTWGGLGERMKFPTPLRWRVLLHQYRRTGDASLAHMVRRTLEKMADGGLYDHVGGGFHRYTVEPTWLIPHFEKMLYDNALLADLYTEAAVVFDDPTFRFVARDTLDFLLSAMRDPDTGAFYASFDADSGGEEGSYYVWTPAELNEVAGPEDGAALAMLLGVAPGGNFEGRSVLTRRVSVAEVAGATARPPHEIDELFDRWRPALLEYRAQRPAPALDRKVVTSWNGLVITALARAGRALGEDRYLAAAAQAAEWILRVHHRPDGALARVSNGGVAAEEAILDDYAFLAEGLLQLYQATGDLDHLRAAQRLVRIVQTRFRHPTAGFYLTPEGHEAPMGRTVEIFDGARPAGLSAMLHVLVQLAALTGEPGVLEDVDGVLGAHGEILEHAGLEMGLWLDVSLLRAAPFYEVVVAGDPEQPETLALSAVMDGLLPPHAVLIRLPAGGASDEARSLLPPVEGKRARGGAPTAYVCRMGSCQRPTTDPGALKRQVLDGWTR